MTDLKTFVSELTTFNDLFLVLNFLLSENCEQDTYISRDAGAIYVTVARQKQLTPTLIIQPAKFTIPIGENGFLVSLYPSGIDELKRI
ncbi:MAG: hypothetical protein MJZ34_14425 [Paludibacteraceae bacterium]|nr:hypothetical protein [Paludibacteraceae bacterium]